MTTKQEARREPDTGHCLDVAESAPNDDDTLDGLAMLLRRASSGSEPDQQAWRRGLPSAGAAGSSTAPAAIAPRSWRVDCLGTGATARRWASFNRSRKSA